MQNTHIDISDFPLPPEAQKIKLGGNMLKQWGNFKTAFIIEQSWASKEPDGEIRISFRRLVSVVRAVSTVQVTSLDLAKTWRTANTNKHETTNETDDGRMNEVKWWRISTFLVGLCQKVGSISFLGGGLGHFTNYIIIGLDWEARCCATVFNALI